MRGVKHKSNLAKLLDDSLESNYWVGFILADGYISELGRLKITIHEIDLKLLQDFCTYVECSIDFITHDNKNTPQYISISLMDKEVMRKLKNKYNIKERKTYNPPEVEFILSPQLIAMYVGFIDGDGSIRRLHKRTDANIAIKCHSSWGKFLTNLQLNLYDFFECVKLGERKEASINNQGYACVTISNNSLLKKLKQFIVDNNLPVLWRKWTNINMEYVNRYETSCINLKRIVELKDKGMSIVDISKELNLKYQRVYQSLNRKGGLP